MKHAPRTTTTTFPLGLVGDAARDAKQRDPTRSSTRPDDGGVFLYFDHEPNPDSAWTPSRSACAAHARLEWHARGANFWVRCGDRDFGSVAATQGDDRVDVDNIPTDVRRALEATVRNWILAALRRPGAVTTTACGTGNASYDITRIPLGVFARQARDLVRRARAECKNSDDASAISVDPRTDEATIEGRSTFNHTTGATAFDSNLWLTAHWSVTEASEPDPVKRRDMVIASVRDTFREIVADLASERTPMPLTPLGTSLGAVIDEAVPLHPSRPAWMQMLEDLALPDDGPDDPAQPWQRPGTRRAHVVAGEGNGQIVTWRCKRVDGAIVDISRDADGGWTTTRVEDAPRPAVPIPVVAESLDLAVARAIHELGQSLTVARIAVSPDAVAGDHPAGPGLRLALDQALAALTCLRGAYERTVARG